MKYQHLSPSNDLDFPVYFEALNEKLNDDRIKNIAIIGPYGSGKSTVIESYFEKFPKYEYLRISLANFCESKRNSPNETVEQNSEKQLKEERQRGFEEYFKEEDEKKVEERILQQLFYQISQNTIPFSGFKRIKYLSPWQQRLLSIATILWLFTLVFIPGIAKLLNTNIETISSIGFTEFWKNIDLLTTIFNIVILLSFSFGLFFMIRKIINIIKKGQLRKIAMKSANVEFSEITALNKHIDELIYFFEASEKNLLIIEDLDRFNSTALFSKLREVNFIINNSPQIKSKKVVKFIYAIRDDVFSSNLNRSKFFDFILPVVPVINTTNSGDKLREMLSEEFKISSSYINDVGLFLHDMRLLKNIVNEYIVYYGLVNTDKRKSEEALFSLIIYKNLFPEEFCKEHTGNGWLRKIFNENKMNIIDDVTDSKLNKIKQLEYEIDNIENEKAEDEEKLRGEYIFEIIKNYPGTTQINNESIDTLLKDSKKFELLLGKSVKVYPGYNIHPNIDFNRIQRSVNPKYLYSQRLQLIKQHNDLNAIKKELFKNKEELKQIKRKKLTSIIKLYQDNKWEKKIFNDIDKELTQDQSLLLLLIRKGYIDENYHLYISYFYEGALSLKDYEFLLNVKKNEGDNFNLGLNNVDEIIARISDDEFENEPTLNKDLILSLIKKTGYKNDYRLDLLLEKFKYLEGAFEKYILPLLTLLETAKKNQQRFIELLVERYRPNLWNDIEKQKFDDRTKDKYLKMFLFLSEANLQSLNYSSGDDSLKRYLESKADFIEVLDSPSDISHSTKLIKAIDLKFKSLTFKKYTKNEVFNFILANNHYEINEEMLYLMLYNSCSMSNEEFKEIFYTQNFTLIVDSSNTNLFKYIESNFEDYIESVFLKLKGSQQESELAVEVLLDFLDHEELNTILNDVFNKISTRITSLKSFGRKEKWGFLFETNSVGPNWDNLLSYFKLNNNTVDKTILNWLNNNGVIEQITRTNLQGNETDDTIFELQTQLIENDSLTIATYKKLLKAFPNIYPKIDLDALSPDKVNTLVKANKLSFNQEHFNLLSKLNLIDDLILFVTNNYNEFVDNYSTYDFIPELHIGLLRSNILKNNDKYSLVELIHIQNISNFIIAELICKVILSTKEPSLKKETIIFLIIRSKDNNLKLKMLDRFLTLFDTAEIDDILRSMGGEYEKASNPRKRPIWESNELNLIIAKKLNDLGYFSSVNVNEKDEIKIVARFM